MASTVQTGTAQLASGGATSVTLTRGVTSGFTTAAPPSRTVLWFTVSGGHNENRNNYVRAIKTDEDTYTFQRAASVSGTLDIRWYLETFDVGEAVVQDVVVTLTSGATSAAISAPSLSSGRFIVPMGTEWNSSGNVGSEDIGRWTIDNDEQVSFRSTAGANLDPLTVAAQVVEIAGTSVQTVQQTETGTTATTLDYAVSAVDLARTLVIGGVEPPAGLTLDAVAWDAFLTTPTNLRLQRNTGTAATFTFTVYVVEFPSGSSVQAVADTETDQSFNATISAVTQADTVVILSGLSTSTMLLGCGRTASTEILLPNRNRFRATTTTTTNVQAVRGGSDTDSQSITFQAFSVVAAVSGPTIDVQPESQQIVRDVSTAVSISVGYTPAEGNTITAVTLERETSPNAWEAATGWTADFNAQGANVSKPDVAVNETGTYRLAVTDDAAATTYTNEFTITVYAGVSFTTSGVTGALGENASCSPVSDYVNVDGEFECFVGSVGGVSKLLCLHFETPP